jgi:excisionase family DNA binding protein
MIESNHLRVVPPPREEPMPQITSDLIDEVSLAARLGVSRSTLQSWRYTGRGPRYLKVGRLVRYRNADVEAYLRASACGGDVTLPSDPPSSPGASSSRARTR